MREMIKWSDKKTGLVYDKFALLGTGCSAGLEDDRCLTDATNVAIPVWRWRVSSSGGMQ